MEIVDSLGNIIVKGDKVVCIDNFAIRSELLIDKVYKVHKVNVNNTIYVVNEGGDVDWYGIHRFRRYVEGCRRDIIDHGENKKHDSACNAAEVSTYPATRRGWIRA